MLDASRRAAWLLALLLLGLFQIAWFTSGVPLALKLGVGGLLAVSALRPGSALLIWAGLAPLTTSLAGLAGPAPLGALLLEAMTMALVLGALARLRGGPPTRLALPAIVMSAVALASGLSELPARFMTTTHEHPGAVAIGQLLFQHAVARESVLAPWYFALVIVEGAALAWVTERLTRRETDLAPRVIWCALAGHAGVAVLNISRVIGASLRTGDYPASLPGFFINIREYTQYDVNAAGSILVMVMLAAIGLASRRARIPLGLTIGLVAIALWVTGSRVAMAALFLTLAGVFILRALRSARMWWVAGGVVLASVALIGWLIAGYPAGRNLNLPRSIASRAVLFKAAIGMTADAPVLGVGAGTFLEESSNYGAAALAPYVHDARTRDNAHNYFLQTLAEQGLVGLAALMAMLAAGLVPALRTGPRRDVLVPWLAAGIIACILTWMTGHPLLLTEAALMFWMFMGILAGLTAPPAASPALARIVAAVAIIVLGSIPFRAVAVEETADLEHQASGMSVWQPSIDGERYREAGSEFSLFLPANTALMLPMRSATATPVTVELRIESRPIDAVVAPPGMWRQVRIQLPESRSRYIKVDFRVTSPGSCPGCLWVGKAVPVTKH